MRRNPIADEQGDEDDAAQVQHRLGNHECEHDALREASSFLAQAPRESRYSEQRQYWRQVGVSPERPPLTHVGAGE